MDNTITVGGLIYERVNDLRTLAPDDRLRQTHENHTVSHMTVIDRYGRHGRDTGVRVRVVDGGRVWTSVLTELSAEAGPVFRAVGHVEETGRDWSVAAITTQTLHCGNRLAAEEVAEDRLHLTVVSRVPGGEWEPMDKPELPVDLDGLSDQELAALQFEVARTLARRQGRSL